MGNPHRAAYIDALSALALRVSGWTRKQRRDVWYFEDESGARLKLKPAAVMWSWGHRETQHPPRFSIARGEVCWDEEEALAWNTAVA